jgi:hypothetical protein
MMMTRKVPRVVLGTVTLLVAATAALSGASAQGSGKLTAQLAVLKRPATPADARLQNHPVAHQLAAGSARLAAVRAAEHVYVARGSNGTICLIIENIVENTVAANCAPSTALENGTIYLSRPNSDGTIDVVGVVDDAHSYVADSGGARPALKNNVFAFDRLSGQHIRLGSVTGERDFDLGPQTPNEEIVSP